MCKNSEKEQSKHNQSRDNLHSDNLPNNSLSGDNLSSDNLPKDNLSDDNLSNNRLIGDNLIDSNGGANVPEAKNLTNEATVSGSNISTDCTHEEDKFNLNWFGNAESSHKQLQNQAQSRVQNRVSVPDSAQRPDTTQQQDKMQKSDGTQISDTMKVEHPQRYAHGGDVWTIAKKLNIKPTEIKDFSTCVSSSFPNDIAPVLLDFTLLGLLPEPYSSSFSTKYTKSRGTSSGIANDTVNNADSLTAENVLLTSGTTEAIATICKIYANKSVSTLQPTYLDYERYALLNNCQMSHINEKEIHNLHKVKCDLLFICNPNNPTGKQFSGNAIKYIADQNPNTLVVIDESYMPFAEERSSLERVAHKSSNIIVLSSFSKVFGVPGLRIGYVVGNVNFINKIKENISPWSVSTLAQQVALKLLALEYTSFEVTDFKARDEFFRHLSDLAPHITPLPSKTHFFICELASNFMTSTELANICADNKFLIRDCSNINGLGDRYIRVSLHKEWKLLINLFKKIITDADMRR